MNVNKNRRISPKAPEEQSAGTADHPRIAHWTGGASGSDAGTRVTESARAADCKRFASIGQLGAGAADRQKALEPPSVVELEL